MKKLVVTTLTILSTGMICLSQTNIKGNVVEYFGRDKVETTDEGVVFHHFTDGYALRTNPRIGTLFNGQDSVAWLYATGRFVAPTREQGNWKSIKADTNSVFNGRELRSSYLYTEYTSPQEQIALLETTGGTRTYINGFPHEGDHYDFGYSLVPVKLRRGPNEFVYTSGRFGRVNSKLVKPSKSVMFTLRDQTLPDIIIGENDQKWAAVRVINATEEELKGMTITATIDSGESVTSTTDQIMPMNVRKVKFRLPATSSTTTGEISAKLTLSDSRGKVLDQTKIKLQQRPATVHHERTFLTRTDSSVQYYSVAPAQDSTGDKALVLTVHGAGVEARNQSRAYSPKDNTHIVAATNRRPYGFNWEEWGRIDALEVMENARNLFKTAPEKTYLTGHSMGGHGTWFLGTTYPDKFAAIAPCASYPDINGYGSSRGDDMHKKYAAFEPFERGANAGRVLSLLHNLKQSGVYVLHGDADRTVPVEQVRQMRSLLGGFHPNFCYYEYPGGEHWYGNHSVDWKPIFEFFERQTIPAKSEVSAIEFHTASPVISSEDYWVKLHQQESSFHFSRINAHRSNDTIYLDAENALLIELDLPSLNMNGNVVISTGGTLLKAAANKIAYVAFRNGEWRLEQGVEHSKKYAERQGGFKQAFDNNVIFVYATGGSAAEREWYMNRARFDAETFYYRGNGSNDVVADVDFDAAKYKDRNVVIYGNSSNNSAWSSLLADSPVQVSRDAITLGESVFRGDNLATYFVQPRRDSDTALVGVVAGTGDSGMRASSANNYISGITGFPDIMIFTTDMLRDGLPEVKAAGFFDNDWSVSTIDVFEQK